MPTPRLSAFLIVIVIVIVIDLAIVLFLVSGYCFLKIFVASFVVSFVETKEQTIDCWHELLGIVHCFGKIGIGFGFDGWPLILSRAQALAT